MTICISAIVMLGMLFFDQITKAWAVVAAGGSEGFICNVIGDIICFRYSKNTGMAWSAFGDNPVAMQVITWLTVAMMIGMGVLFFTLFKKNRPAQIALAVIEAGALGNFIDRVVFSYVRDFIDVSKLGFGICNIADFCVVFGAIALFIVILFVGKDAVFPHGKYKKLREEEKKAKQENKAQK